MPNNLLTNSELIVGLLLNKKQTLTAYSVEKFSPQYQPIVKDMKDGKGEAELVVKYGSTIIQTAKHAAESVNGMGSAMDWAEALDISYRNEVVISDLNKAMKYAEMGDTEKLTDFLRRANTTLTSSQRLRSVLASEISDTYEPYIKSGSTVWDEHLGGIPNVGLVVIGAKTATGKTTLAISLMESFLKEYPTKKILFVTLEDMNEGWKFRAKQILGNRDKEFWSRIRVMEFAENPESIIEEASRFDDIGAIWIDYLEYMVEESDVSTYTRAYKTFASGSKSLAVNNSFRSMPIFLLAQFGKTLYSGGVPTPEALPYVDQRFIYQEVMLYQPDSDWYSDNAENPYVLPPVKGKGYIVCWKSKNSRPHDPEFPGAIQVNHSPKYGYDLNSPSSAWLSLASDTKREVVKKNRK